MRDFVSKIQQLTSLLLIAGLLVSVGCGPAPMTEEKARELVRSEDAVDTEAEPLQEDD